MSTLGHYITCDDALCDTCFNDPEYVWPGFESWEAPLTIMDTTASDTPTHCCECHELIPHELTPDGYGYVESAIEGLILGDGGSGEVVKAWWLEYGDDCELKDIIDNAIEARV